MTPADLENVLRIFEIISFVAGGAAIIWRMAKMATRFELIGAQQSKEIGELKRGIEGLSSVLVTLATQAGRIDRVEDRQLSERKRVDEIATRINTLVDNRSLALLPTS